MLDTQTKSVMSNITSNEHTIDISCWEEVPLTRLNARQKRRFQKHKAAITAYFTADASLDEIAKQQDIAKQSVVAMAEKCLMYHADGHVWGFRALLPGAKVVDHAPSEGQRTLSIEETSTNNEPCIEDDEDSAVTTKRPAIVVAESVKLPTILSVCDPVGTALSRPVWRTDWRGGRDKAVPTNTCSTLVSEARRDR